MKVTESKALLTSHRFVFIHFFVLTFHSAGGEECHVVAPLMEACRLAVLLGEQWAGVERPEGHLLGEAACPLHPPEVAQPPALDHLNQGHPGCSPPQPSPTSNTSMLHHKQRNPNRIPMKNM